MISPCAIIWFKKIKETSDMFETQIIGLKSHRIAKRHNWPSVAFPRERWRRRRHWPYPSNIVPEKHMHFTWHNLYSVLSVGWVCWWISHTSLCDKTAERAARLSLSGCVCLWMCVWKAGWGRTSVCEVSLTSLSGGMVGLSKAIVMQFSMMMNWIPELKYLWDTTLSQNRRHLRTHRCSY